MKKRTFQLLFLVVAGMLTVETVQAQGTAFTYQGRLNTVGGAANGSYDMLFTLYATNSDSSAVAGPLTNSAVAVSNGLFTVTLDFGGGMFDGNPRWLEIGVRTNGAGAFTTLSPRQAVLPVPYAIAAGNLVGSATNQVNSLIQGATNAFIGTVTNIVIGQGYVTGSVTNGLATTNFVNTITNGLATTNYVTGQGYVTGSVTNGLATTNYVNTATNNFGNSVAVTLTNAANQFTGSFIGNGSGLTNITSSATNAIGNNNGTGTNLTVINVQTNIGVVNSAYSGNGVDAFIVSGTNQIPGGSKSYMVGNGGWTSFPVPYLRSLTGALALDLLPQSGTTNKTWMDICSRWDGANGEYLHLASPSATGGATQVGSSAQGNGTVRPIWFDPYGGSSYFGTGSNLIVSADGSTITGNTIKSANFVGYGVGLTNAAGNGFLDLTATNALATTNYVNTAMNNFGNIVAVNLTNAANQFVGTFTNSAYYGNGSGLTNILAAAMRATNSPVNGDALRYTNGTFYWAP